MLFAGLMLSAPYAASALDLKGVELGQQATCEQLAKLGMDKYTCAAGLKSYWEGGTGIEGVAVDTAVTFDRDHVVQAISAKFDPIYFDQLLAAAIAKWGRPTNRSQVNLTNAFGVKVVDVIIEWAQPDGHLVTLAKYEDLEHGVLRLGMPAPKTNTADSRM